MKNSKSLINNFFRWGLFLIVLLGINFLNKRGLYFFIGTSGKGLQLYQNFMGVIYNISTIMIPIVSIILFKLFCDIIYLFITLLENKPPLQ